MSSIPGPVVNTGAQDTCARQSTPTAQTSGLPVLVNSSSVTGACKMRRVRSMGPTEFFGVGTLEALHVIKHVESSSLYNF